MTQIKQKRDAKATKAKILSCARELFSTKGFDATTMDDVAKLSGYNKALIYYYFKSKSNLYGDVMSGLFDAIYDEIENASKKASSVFEELEIFIKTYGVYCVKHPYLPSLLLRELSNNGAYLPDIMFASMRRLYALLCDILNRGKEEGSFACSMSMSVHFMIIGTINLMLTTKPLRIKAAKIEALDTCSDCDIDEITSYVYKSIKKSLEVV